MYIFRTDENASGGCPPFSNNMHMYDETVQPTVVRLHIGFDIGLPVNKLENLNGHPATPAQIISYKTNYLTIV